MGIPSNEIKNLKKSLRLPTETPLRKKSLDQTLFLNAKICVCDDNYEAKTMEKGLKPWWIYRTPGNIGTDVINVLLNTRENKKRE